jgi:hypothetical protein
MPSAAKTQVPVAFAQVRHLPPQTLSQQTPSTQKLDPHSVSEAQTAPFGLRPKVQVWSTDVQKLGAVQGGVALESVAPAGTPVQVPGERLQV